MLSRPEGELLLGDVVVPRRVLESSEFYNDWLKPQDLDNGIGTAIVKTGGQSMFFSLMHS